MRIRRKLTERGNTLVEAAFILLTFVAILVGAADMARIMFIHNAVNERVRDVARKATIYEYTPDQVKNLIVYNSLTPPTQAQIDTNYPGYQGMVLSNVSVEYLDAGTNDRRVKVVVAGMRIVTLSPWMRGVASNIPLALTVPMETP